MENQLEKYKEQQILKLQQSFSKISVNEKGEMSLSVYNDTLTGSCVAQCVKKIKDAFPDLPVGFYAVLSDRIKHGKFTDKRLIDSVNNVIDICVYPRPTIAQFVSWDKRIPMFTYDQMVKKFNESEMGAKFWDYYKQFKHNDKPVWIHINDIEQYNIE